MNHPRILFQKVVDGRRTAQFSVSARTAERIDQILQAEGAERTKHGNSRAVEICGPPNREAYQKRIERHEALPIEDWWFPSATAASQHFGYSHNEIAQALSRAQRRGEAFAVVAGVPLRWADSGEN